MATFNGIDDKFKKHIEQLAQKAMSQGNAVKSKVIETGKKHTQTDVYDVYSPKVYERTGELKDSWNWQDTEDGIEIINTRTDEDTGKYIPDSIEYGRNYEYNFEYSNKPRPFIENTRIELSKGDGLKNALKQDMKNLGLDVK